MQRSTFFCWAGGMFQFTAPFAYPSSMNSRVAHFQDECIIFSLSCDNILWQAEPKKASLYSTCSNKVHIGQCGIYSVAPTDLCSEGNIKLSRAILARKDITHSLEN